ncbi:MAG: hypothetical protein HZA92_17240 [Verrucomicrobia bacterium]|nr:hypothetical protein [Verrucomicrobiota bacterium]
MPKDEFDFEDPLELNGVAILTEEDTSAEMTGCFAEEFMRMGYNHKQVLALFRNPHYTGPNMVLANKGEPFVRDIIAETFARWGRPVQWPATAAVIDLSIPPPAGGEPAAPRPVEAFPIYFRQRGSASGGGDAPAGLNFDPDENLTDPLGNPAPKLNI